MLFKQKVSVNLGATLKLDPKNPKEFEFIRLDVGYEREIPYREDRTKAYEEAWSIVEEELTGAVTELRKKIQDTNAG